MATKHRTMAGTNFDFEVGTLSVSPCRKCVMRHMLPTCSNGCKTLARVQTILSGTVASGHSVSHLESYSYCLMDRAN